MRLARFFALAVTALAIAACSAEAPGWTYAPAPSITPLPSTAASAPPEGSAAPSPAAPSEGAATSEPEAPSGEVLEISALNIAFDKTELTAPADAPFQIKFSNDDAGIPHNVEIKDAGGTSVFTGEIFNGVDERTYDVPALSAGTYTFLCTVHPNMTGTLTVQ